MPSISGDVLLERGLQKTRAREVRGLVIKAEEVSHLDLRRVRLAVLSACRTAIGSTYSGEGLSSLRRAFAQAGLLSVISSVWSVPDESTQDLMRRFYTHHWQERMAVLSAFRQAALELLATGAPPLAWGGCVVSGSWR